jgi:hypothetical protein
VRALGAYASDMKHEAEYVQNPDDPSLWWWKCSCGDEATRSDSEGRERSRGESHAAGKNTEKQ